jgi:hypothetical protein
MPAVSVVGTLLIVLLVENVAAVTDFVATISNLC